MRPRYLHQEFDRCLLSLDGHDYPTEYRWLRAHGFKGLTPWHCLDDASVAAGWRREFAAEAGGGSIPVRDILPFAYAQHTDDVAGFVVSGGTVTPQVCVAHLTWSGKPEEPGWPSCVLFPGVWDWFRAACAESQEWCSPEELTDLTDNIMD
ncbi:hypothetical protein [Fimbriiglobus ruber]|uniref:Uncharacterized protein n=1 Tax=Fimbriiglobus ruber TaxID=1908690 RepID=A0A225DNS8_9BACT|nr:hypothetical protein [Fimbriiglobus ruber]OWK37817.1 hypothetical protein FRUB_06937 [Fimbriiglobus ruber]